MEKYQREYQVPNIKRAGLGIVIRCITPWDPHAYKAESRQKHRQLAACHTDRSSQAYRQETAGIGIDER